MTQEQKSGLLAMYFTVLAVVGCFWLATIIGPWSIAVTAVFLIVIFLMAFGPASEAKDHPEALFPALAYVFGIFGFWVLVHPVAAVVAGLPVLVLAIVIYEPENKKAEAVG